ncbi:7-cyano-7-deazaguanine synthase QueC [bacterium]|nr:7-cyano-7-deazaguanine synthase QueC [bacterium]
MSSSVVLLSGGLDSTVNFLEALKDGGVQMALTFNYGQRAALQEINSAKKLCAKHQVQHQVIELPFFKLFTKTSLVEHQQKIPTGGEINIDSYEKSLVSADKVWVPNRNGIFLNIAAGFAEGLGVSFVVPGFNLEEATTFPDNSADFQAALDGAFSFSTQNKVKIKCYTLRQNKTEILKRGLDLGMDIKDVWPCYFGEAKWCGTCESCLRFQNALRRVGVIK